MDDGVQLIGHSAVRYLKQCRRPPRRGVHVERHLNTHDQSHFKERKQGRSDTKLRSYVTIAGKYALAAPMPGHAMEQKIGEHMEVPHVKLVVQRASKQNTHKN